MDDTFRRGLAFAAALAGFGGMTQLAKDAWYIPYLWAICWALVLSSPLIWWWEDAILFVRDYILPVFDKLTGTKFSGNRRIHEERRGRESTERMPTQRADPRPQARTVAIAASTAHKIVPSDADSVTTALRQIRDVIGEAGRDSTTIPGHFKYFDVRQSASLDQIKAWLAEARDLGRKTNDGVSAIVARYRSFSKDLEPFSGCNDFPTTLISDIESYRLILDALGKIDGTSLQIVKDFNNRIAVGLDAYYKQLHDLLGEVDARIEQIRQQIAS